MVNNMKNTNNTKMFLASNKVQENKEVRYAPTKSFLDEEGKPVEWVLKPLTTELIEEINASCMKNERVVGKKGMFKKVLDDNLFVARLITNSVVMPDLQDKELQDSYNVMKPEDLLKKLVDSAGEYSKLGKFVLALNDFDDNEEVEVE